MKNIYNDGNHPCTLSVIIPVYNEEKTICQILEKIKNVQLLAEIKKEIILVDDHSSDNSQYLIKNYIKENPEMKMTYLYHPVNSGKGMAIRTGISAITGDYVIIQDADLEYNPQNYNQLLKRMLGEDLSVVYGSRFLERTNKHSYQAFYWGGRLVSFVTNILYSQKLTDEPTCYKMFKTDLLKSITLSCTGFEFCPEVTAKVAKKGIKIKEVPIDYYPRSVEEGKKIKWYDGVEAIWTLLRYRFSN